MKKNCEIDEQNRNIVSKSENDDAFGIFPKDENSFRNSIEFDYILNIKAHNENQ